MLKATFLILAILLISTSLLSIIYADDWFKNQKNNYPVITWDEVRTQPYTIYEAGNDYL